MKFHRSITGFICGVLVAIAIGACAQKSNSSFTPLQVKDIQNIVHQYLVSNPQVLIEVSQALQKQQLNKIENDARKVIMANGEALFNSPLAPVAGNKNGSVTMVEFFDYQCPHCIFMARIVDSLMKMNKNLRVVSMDFPIFGAISEYAARAALAAGKQGKYWQMHDALFAANKRLSKPLIDQIARKVGLNITKLKKDMMAADVSKQLSHVRMLATKLRLSGTPAFIIGPTNYRSAPASKFSFFPGQTSGQMLQEFIMKAK